MTMTTTLCIIVAMLAIAFFAVRFFGKSEPEDEDEVMRLTRKGRTSVPKPE